MREDASSISPKRERVRHAMRMASKLPPPYTRHTPREQQLLAAADAFCARWQADPCAAGRLPPCVSLMNECGVPKTVCTTLRPTQLPHIDLQDLDTITQVSPDSFNPQTACCLHPECNGLLCRCSIDHGSGPRKLCLQAHPGAPACLSPRCPQFVAEFVKCEPLEQSDKPPSHLISPASLLDWQVRNTAMAVLVPAPR